MKIRLIRIEDIDLKEKDFPSYIKEQGYNCKKLRGSNINKIKRILGHDFEEGIGMPDFLVYNSKDKFLCEFKSISDSWRLHQIEWATKNFNVPLALAYVIKDNEEDYSSKDFEIDLDTSSDEMFETINISWKLKHFYLNDYVNKHPEVVGRSLNRQYDKNGEEYYLGKIPSEVSEKWNIFNNVYFKNKKIGKILMDRYKAGKIRDIFDIEIIISPEAIKANPIDAVNAAYESF